MADLHDVQIGDRLFSELSPVDQDSLLLAANILVQWIVQEAEKKRRVPIE